MTFEDGFILDAYDQCATCGKWHYTHADEDHAFESSERYIRPKEPEQGQEEFECTSTTHHLGCYCYEARRNQEISRLLSALGAALDRAVRAERELEAMKKERAL